MSLFTELTLVTNSNLVSMNYLKMSKKNSKNGCTICSTLFMKMKKGYTESLYDGVGWTEEVKTFLRY